MKDRHEILPRSVLRLTLNLTIARQNPRNRRPRRCKDMRSPSKALIKQEPIQRNLVLIIAWISYQSWLDS